MANLMITVYTINELRGSAAIIFSDNLDFSNEITSWFPLRKLLCSVVGMWKL